jgi:hypothetical protein
MNVFKFGPCDHVACLLKGNVWCGNLRFFRLLELASGDPHIGDQMEGLQPTVASLIRGDDKANAEILDHLKGYVHVEGSTEKLVFENNKFIKRVDGFALCFSVGNFDDLTKAVRDGCFGSAAYDHCLSIERAEDFAKALWEHGKFREGNISRPVKDAFAEPVCDMVSYDLEDHDIRNGPVREASPFRKLPRFAAQREWRIFFEGKPSWDMDHLVITCDPAVIKQFAHEVKTGIPAPPAPQRVDRDHFKILLKVYENWDRFNALWGELQRLMQPEYFDEHSSGLWKAYMEQMGGLNKQLTAHFDAQYRLELTRAYFEVRKQGHKDQLMDDAILMGSEMFVLIVELRKMLRRLGRLPDPWALRRE